MRRRFHGLLFVSAMAMVPAIALAAPPRQDTHTEKRPRPKAAPRAAKSALAVKTEKTESRPAAAPERLDICSIGKPQPKSVTLRTHRIERGDSLSAIAWRYGTSVKALAAANAITVDQKIKTGQKLVIPQHSRLGGGDDWLRYAAPPKQRGRLDLITYKSHFRGAVIENGKIVPSARQAVSALLGAKSTPSAISERLIRLLVRVSDTFGGRTIHVVSGYRSTSYFADSRHKSGEAVDFSIVGVPNVVLRQYLLLLDDVGVGYYPNSSFVHLDVRGCPMQWVDYAGPGEAPRRTPRQPPRNVVAVKKAEPSESSWRPLEKSDVSDRDENAEKPQASARDEIVEKVVAAMEEASKIAPEIPDGEKRVAGDVASDSVATSHPLGSRH
jgi:uncharacterized protein YcbK (DUF882 family)